MHVFAAFVRVQFCVIDDKLLTNGSYNWTKTASNSNQENIVVTNQVCAV